MEEQKLAKQLFDSAFSMKKQKDGKSEEKRIWVSFLEKLNRELAVSGCGAKAETYVDSVYYQQACGYHGDYGYFFISCGDRGDCSIMILEMEEEMAANRFLEHIIDKRAYEWVLEVKDRGNDSWPYRCRYDYRVLWFGKALEWLAPVVDWAFFAECADRYIGLLNRWFEVPHWEYDYQFGRIIENSDSIEISDTVKIGDEAEISDSAKEQ